jgi:hypothetical protein
MSRSTASRSSGGPPRQRTAKELLGIAVISFVAALLLVLVIGVSLPTGTDVDAPPRNVPPAPTAPPVPAIPAVPPAPVPPAPVTPADPSASTAPSPGLSTSGGSTPNGKPEGGRHDKPSTGDTAHEHKKQ